MKVLTLLAFLSFAALANPTPVLDCHYENGDIKASVQIMNSSSPQDAYTKFQTYYYYRDLSEGILISDLVRYEEMFDKVEVYLFKSNHKKMSFEIDKITLTGVIHGLSSMSEVEFKCESYVDLETLKSHSSKGFEISL